jgi:hypothetical protein
MSEPEPRTQPQSCAEPWRASAVRTQPQHRYDALTISPLMFLLEVMRSPDVPIHHRLAVAEWLMQNYPELHQPPSAIITIPEHPGLLQ